MSDITRFEKCFGGAFLAVLCALQGSCSILLDTSAQQCVKDSDCRSRGGSFLNAKCENQVCRPPDAGGGSGGGTGGSGGSGGGSVDAAPDVPADPVWGCLDNIVLDPPLPGMPMVEVTLPFFDLINMVPITGVGVRVCPKLDVTCSRPLNTQLAIADDMGISRVKVPSGFDGYGQVIELTDGGEPISGGAADAGDAGDAAAGPIGRLVPSTVYFNPPIVRDTAYGIVPLFSRNDIDMLAQVQGNTWDRSLGIMFVGILDCSRKPVSGATWDPSIVDMRSKRFFYINGLPDESASATDATGFGGLLNAPTGSITVNARVQATGKRVGSATVLVRAGSAVISPFSIPLRPRSAAM